MSFRVRSADPTVEGEPRHWFIELFHDQWYEVEPNFPNLSSEEKLAGARRLAVFETHSSVKHICYASRAFNIGLVKNWKEEDWIEG